MTKQELIAKYTQDCDFLNTLLNLDYLIPEGSQVYDVESGGWIDLGDLIEDAREDFIYAFCKE